MLVRKHIQQRLAAYFSQPHSHVIGSLPSCHNQNYLNFKTLLGSWHFQRILANLYKQDSRNKPSFQWLTPVELFRPFYSNILADYIVNRCLCYDRDTDTFNYRKRLKIIECGAGRGTNALFILERLKKRYPSVYASLSSYTLLDASSTLQELQHETVSPLHKEKVKYIHQDLGDDDFDFTWNLSGDACDDTQVVVIGLEVLDNLPHDKVMRLNTDSGSSENDNYLQAEIVQSSNSSLQEILEESFKPLTDKHLKTVLHDLPDFGPKRVGTVRWIPTVACNFIRKLYQTFPEAAILFADFDYLPPASNMSNGDYVIRSIDAEWDPLVTDMDGVDYECYLSSPKLCDILFPTDFVRLSQYVKLYCHPDLKVKIHKQGHFMNTFGSEEVSLTKSWFHLGYSPLVDEFLNCSILSVSNQ